MSAETILGNEKLSNDVAPTAGSALGGKTTQVAVVCHGATDLRVVSTRLSSEQEF